MGCPRCIGRGQGSGPKKPVIAFLGGLWAKSVRARVGGIVCIFVLSCSRSDVYRLVGVWRKR